LKIGACDLPEDDPINVYQTAEVSQLLPYVDLTSLNAGSLAALVITVGEYQEMIQMLDEVAGAGVVFEDERIKYVEVQINRPTWDAIQAWKQRNTREEDG
jgi:hypothetical protein